MKVINPIYFVHYGIGRNDGVNVVLRNLAKGIFNQDSQAKIIFVGGEIKNKNIENVLYLKIPELKPPSNRNLTKKKVFLEARKIAEKLARLTASGGVVVNEDNKFLYLAKSREYEKIKLELMVNNYENSTKFTSI